METDQTHEPWNKGKPVGQKPPFKPKDISAIGVHLQNDHQLRDLAMFNLAVDSKLRGCDLANPRVRDVMHADQILSRKLVVQRKTQRPVQFKLTEPTRSAVAAWIETADLTAANYLFPQSPGEISASFHASVRPNGASVGRRHRLDSAVYGMHSMRRSKATLIDKRTKNLRAVQLLLGHTKLESTVRYLGIEVDDALEISEQIEI
jgi:site-specific recombinase XerC